MSADPYGDWRDSECAPFIRAITEDKESRDVTRLVWADWLEEQGDLDHVRHLRNERGYWQESTLGTLSWCVDCCGNEPGMHLPLLWVGWNWSFPSREWLQSEQCRRLVKAWCENLVCLEEYPWAMRIANEQGWRYHSYRSKNP